MNRELKKRGGTETKTKTDRQTEIHRHRHRHIHRETECFVSDRLGGKTVIILV